MLLSCCFFFSKQFNLYFVVWLSKYVCYFTGNNQRFVDNAQDRALVDLR